MRNSFYRISCVKLRSQLGVTQILKVDDENIQSNLIARLEGKHCSSCTRHIICIYLSVLCVNIFIFIYNIYIYIYIYTYV
ncbi:hypothetical protein PUN28_018828 [Cardiocondyla obscurior]|uniref:Uncharacterized protein n=1 Tax=Cardiocondyla obscurior TaxID=286306 RepID=A0AAW2EE94_9HYME